MQPQFRVSCGCVVSGVDRVLGENPTTVLTNGGFTEYRMRVKSWGITSLVGAEETVDTIWLVLTESAQRYLKEVSREGLWSEILIGYS